MPDGWEARKAESLSTMACHGTVASSDWSFVSARAVRKVTAAHVGYLEQLFVKLLHPQQPRDRLTELEHAPDVEAGEAEEDEQRDAGESGARNAA